MLHAHTQFGGGGYSDELSVQTEESIAEMLGHVTKVLSHLTDGHNLFLLKGSQRLVSQHYDVSTDSST